MGEPVGGTGLQWFLWWGRFAGPSGDLETCCSLVPEGGAGCPGVGLLLVLGITRLSSGFLRSWWSLLVVRLIIWWNSLRHDGCTFLFFCLRVRVAL